MLNSMSSGISNIQKYSLELLNNGFYSDYDIDIDPTISNVFAASVGQFFYALYREEISFLPIDRQVTDRTFFIDHSMQSLVGESPSKLSDLFYNPSSLYFKGRLDSLLRW